MSNGTGQVFEFALERKMVGGEVEADDAVVAKALLDNRKKEPLRCHIANIWAIRMILASITSFSMQTNVIGVHQIRNSQ